LNNVLLATDSQIDRSLRPECEDHSMISNNIRMQIKTCPELAVIPRIILTTSLKSRMKIAANSTKIFAEGIL
jgi:hypothetical protein